MKRAVAVFIRSPRPGMVKTRLAASVGAERACAVYMRLAAGALRAAGESGADRFVFFSPDDDAVYAAERFGLAAGEMVAQGDGDIGERLCRAFEDLFNRGYEMVVLCGSDIAGLNPEVLIAALDAFETAPAVLGPSADGGYYLIGFRAASYRRGFFEGIAWSTSTVCRETMHAMAEESVSVRLLTELSDVDTVSDLDGIEQS